MTDSEYQEELRYRIEERLGLLCGDSKPTSAQYQQATDEASVAIKKLYDESASRP